MLFQEVLGQKTVKEQLINAVKANRVPHAQLFFGPTGSGKLAMAMAYVQYLFCEKVKESLGNDSCGICPSCLKISKLNHPDLHFSFPVLATDHKTSDVCLQPWRTIFNENPYFDINEWKNKIGATGKKPIIGKAEADSIYSKMLLKSYEGNKKVLIMWMAESMNVSAANHLLKMIEEPPKETVLLLIADSTENILPTITSRTQFLRFKALSQEEIQAGLMSKYNVGELKAENIAKIVEGDFFMASQKIGQKEDRQNLDLLRNWMRLCFNVKVVELTAFIDQVHSIGREKQKDLLSYSLHFFRQCMLKNYIGNSHLQLDSEELDFATKFAPFVKSENLEEMMIELDKAWMHVDRNVYGKIIFMDLSFTISKLIRNK